MGRYLPRNISSRTTGIGVIMLIILFMLAGQRTIPQLFSNFLPAEANCTSLARPEDPDRHQSLVQREASADGTPIDVRVRLGGLNEDGSRTITVILTNGTVGTLPIRVPNDPIGNPNGFINVGTVSNDGVGILVNSTFAQTTLQDARTPLAEDQVRMLVPLQSCSISQTFTGAQLAGFGISQGASITGYYRNSTSGVINQRDAQSIFGDMGLWVGAVASDPEVVPVLTTIQANAGG